MTATLPLPKVSRYSSLGFTLIELLVASGIIAILLVIAFASYRLFTKQANLETTSQKIVSTLELARTQTLASKDESQYGVHFETTKYVLFKGVTYNPVDTENQEYTLDAAEVYDINLDGGSEVVFARVRGTTMNNGSVSVRLTDDVSRTETILINSSGAVGLEESVSPTDTRITDSRHLHFDLGWSIQNSTTLTFNFYNDSFQKNIPMANFFDAGKTEFSWEGTINVNGSDQTLMVNTHSLDAIDTTLSIHRSRLVNDKAVRILIDGNEIVSYDSAGVETVGGFGGAMTPQ